MEDNDDRVLLRDAMERAADGLPPLPDLGPLAVREGRRRRTRARFAVGAVCGVLVAGALGLTALLPRPAADVAGVPPRTAAEALRERIADHQRKAAALLDELLPAKVTDVRPRSSSKAAEYLITVNGDWYTLLFSVRPAAPADLLHCATRAADMPSCEEDTQLRTGPIHESTRASTVQYQYRKSRVQLSVYAGPGGALPTPVTVRDLHVVTDDPRFLELVKAADADPMETPAPLDPSEDPMDPFPWL
ncbi:hypothetical protein J3A78_004462 [Streptomyces sp. PvR006]|uniref:hypothetical protein n=1 Tax=unclassified Streptomyces TaxID=2593676 RepID=UPI001AE4C2AA|nr:hypothetical protein [Streptomyces sp. PvR006]MBP2583984.1 hypothetical protein [Streptomyces sp. PvR006]